ncbi:DUF4271 domain-containing protein [Galbibacter sp. BG1]|uniref:DUF4271 domain-containing protein n=1 Tax=Galbibacter sp. BG1 TaxID=1170699 RepID=UPI002107946F|nr:DUF4271 domain-containing protein [Galbibacter sp. BG1]
MSLSIAKLVNEQKFYAFVSLFLNYKYLKIYSKEPNQSTSVFNFFLFIPQLIAISLIVWITIEYFQLPHSINPYLILPFLFLFILFKFYLEKIIATVFDIQPFVESFHFHKVTYRNLSALIVLPIISLFIYSDLSHEIIFYLLLFTFVSLNVIAMILTLRNHQKLIGKYLFYFILYLCALEIAPYLIVIKFYFIDKASN